MPLVMNRSPEGVRAVLLGLARVSNAGEPGTPLLPVFDRYDMLRLVSPSVLQSSMPLTRTACVCAVHVVPAGRGRGVVTPLFPRRVRCIPSQTRASPLAARAWKQCGPSCRPYKPTFCRLSWSMPRGGWRRWLHGSRRRPQACCRPWAACCRPCAPTRSPWAATRLSCAASLPRRLHLLRHLLRHRQRHLPRAPVLAVPPVLAVAVA